ncbi:hypothetical protein BJY04DRAFT_185275 [Aspergillus karnatakaensis]|uniref:uncharacterized protein n=1 Tax=Aspergillus karnatakaensis TaxID=1810916 RepID=UPI003CCD628C
MLFLKFDILLAFFSPRSLALHHQLRLTMLTYLYRIHFAISRLCWLVSRAQCIIMRKSRDAPDQRVFKFLLQFEPSPSCPLWSLSNSSFFRSVSGMSMNTSPYIRLPASQTC